MDRRRFLRVVTVAAGTAAAANLAGCNDDDDDDQIEMPEPDPQIVEGSGFFPQSVASGDPRPDSVIFWTRVADEATSGDITLRLQVARDEGFGDLVVDQSFSAQAQHDNALKVRVTELESRRDYFYRFLYLTEGNFQASRTGRTRTAPAPDANVTVRFAQLSCQDYGGRFYNTLLPLLDEDLDFVLHLGDYVYETIGDESFQDVNSERQVQFRALDEAIEVPTATGSFFAANSIGNYRDLYRTYRADGAMQRLAERFPLVATWDDHEFSDDSWQANGTYFAGLRNEESVERKRNAEQVYFEYMPVDPLGGDQGAIEIDDGNRFPDTVLYRGLRFGANVELLVTDYRTYRPDHLIPEDAFPGTVVVTEDELRQLTAPSGIDFDTIRDNFSPYVNVDEQPVATLKPVLVGVTASLYESAGFNTEEAQARAEEAISGNVATTVINSLLDGFNATVPPSQQLPLLDENIIAAASRGIAYFTMGKTEFFGDLGSRLFVVKDTYDLFAARQAVFAGPQTQNAYGDTQLGWLQTRLLNSDARWKFVGNSCSNTSLFLDLSDPALGVPAPFNQRFYLNLDQWDGFPNLRAELLENLYGQIPGVVLLAGDIHASFATEYPQGTVEYTVSSVSSGTFGTLVANAAAANEDLAPIAEPLLPLLDDFLASANPLIRHVQTERNGVGIVEADSEKVSVRFLELPPEFVMMQLYDQPGAVRDALVELRFENDASGLRQLSAKGTGARTSERTSPKPIRTPSFSA